MAKQTLIIVHGMGEHTEASFKAEVTESLNYALSLYPPHKDKKIDDLVDIIGFEYNTVFNEHREAMADATQPLADRLAALRAKDLYPIEGDIAIWDRELAGDSFFRTHWLDVLFYRYTFLAEPIRIKLAQAINDAIDAKGAQHVHILGHSLGTSVVHDTLASLYAVFPGHKRVKNLDPNAHQLGSVHMVANVSRLLQSFVKVGESVVHPCQSGCTRTYYQYRHTLDPIMLPSPFEPVANTLWLDPTVLSKLQYQLMRPSLVTDLNTHAITHYLRDPHCHVPLLRVLRLSLKDADIEYAAALYSQRSLQGKAEELRDRWEKLKLTDRWEGLKLASLDDAAGFIKAAQALRDMLANYGKPFK